MQNVERFGDLGIQCLIRVDKLEELSVVHLEEHASDLASQFGLRTANTVSAPFNLHAVKHSLHNSHVDDFAHHLLLLHGRRVGQGRS